MLAGYIHSELTKIIIGGAIRVHKALGPGLLESAYEACLHHALVGDGLVVNRQVALPLEFEGVVVEAGYRIDLLVENKVIVELKAVKSLEPIHEAQILTYLRLSGLRVGLLMNFNTLRIRDGINRYAL